MAEELVLEKPTVTTDPFDGSNEPVETKITDVVIEKKEDPLIVEKKEDPVIVVDKKDEVIIEKKEDPAVIEKKETIAEPFKYANEDSKRVHELLLEGKTDVVLDILNQQKKLDKLLAATVDKNVATDILKLKLETSYSSLSKEQIDYKFNKMYSIPKEPVQKATEEDDDFNERVNEWKEAVKSAETDLLIDAEMAKPELQKLKIDLVLPKTENNNVTAKEPTPEELATEQNAVAEFIQKANAVVNSFDGISVSYKDKDVDIQSTYSLSDEEKTKINGQMKLLAEKGYNSNAIFAERWVNADSSFNYNQIAKDLATLETQDKAAQKFVSDTTAKAKIQFMKEKHNIDLGGVNTGGDLQLEDKTTQQKNEDAIWN